MQTFKDKVLKEVEGIKRGEVLSYKEVARRAGRPKAYRAVGNILAKNFNPKVPCHRVIRSDGRIGGYNRGRKAKKELLKKENYSLNCNTEIDIQKPVSSRPPSLAFGGSSNPILTPFWEETSNVKKKHKK